MYLWMHLAQQGSGSTTARFAWRGQQRPGSVAGSRLREEVRASLRQLVAGIEQIGSSSVLGLLSKPIVDLAADVAEADDLAAVTEQMESLGWVYRGDAGDNGGHVLVLEDRPWHRVAHLHVVEHDGTQWRKYIRFRDLLRRSTRKLREVRGRKIAPFRSVRDRWKGLHRWQDGGRETTPGRVRMTGTHHGDGDRGSGSGDGNVIALRFNMGAHSVTSLQDN